MGTPGGGRRVKGFVLSRVKLECTGGGNNRSFGSHGFTLTAKPKVRDGKFRITESKPLGSWTQTLKGGGRFTRKAKARGTLNLTVSKPGITCTTGESTWKATLK